MIRPWTVSSSSDESKTGSHSQENSSVRSAGCNRTSSSTSNHRTITVAELASSSRKIKYGRFLFGLVLVVAAAVMGYGAYSLMDSAQTQMASDRFDSICERALSVAQYVIEEKKRATDALALMMGSAHPNASVGWPMVALEGYTQIASSLGIITHGTLSFCPIVKPGGEEQRLFEEYAYELFAKEGYPNTTGVSDFGKGIFSFGTGEFGNETWEDGRFHITSGWTYHNSTRNILVPFLQSDYGPHPALMLNVNFEHRRAAVIDAVMNCSEERELAGDYRECGGITDLMWSQTIAEDVEAGPAGLFIIPIYPRLDNTTLTGFIVTKQIWGDLLRYTFEPSVSGIDVVLYTKNDAHTYRVTAGEIDYVGQGWVYHDPDARFQVTGTRINGRFFSNDTIEYFMDIYSSQEFIDIAGSFGDKDIANVPVTVCVAAVCIMLFTSLLFVLYDSWVQKEFNSKQRLLDAKRQFVRFISHEVRTPLNTICMGLALLQHDLEAVLGLHHKPMAAGTRKVSVETITEEDESADEVDTSCTPNDASTRVSSIDCLKVKKSQVKEWMKLADQVSKNAESAVSVLSDLLNYDKIQMGALSLELSLVDLWRKLENNVQEFKMAAREKNVNLTLDFSPLLDLSLDKSFHGSIIFKKNGVDQPTFLENEVTCEDLPADVRMFKVIADTVRLEQVFRNLLSNALKFTKNGGNLMVRATIRECSRWKQKEEIVKVRGENSVKVLRIGTAMVSVIDDGVGMTSDQVSQVFNDGTQFNANLLQAGGGSGLGLSIARGLVIQHGGELSCTSDGLGKGTTFTVTLPIYEEIESMFLDNDESMRVEVGDQSTVTHELFRDKQTLSIALEKAKEESSDFVIPTLRILVVDDAMTNRKLCMRILDRAGHTTEGACDGNEAVEKVRKSLENGDLYDCILLDYEMPIMRGPTACEHMRKIGCSSFIVGVTGNVMSEDVDHFRNCGANWVLPKPFRLEALEQQLIEQGVVPCVKAVSEQTEATTLLVDTTEDVDGDLSY